MLKALLCSALLLCAIVGIVAQSEVKEPTEDEKKAAANVQRMAQQMTGSLQASHVRSQTLRMIDGDTTERTLHLERCLQSSLQESCEFAIDGEINQESWSNECAVTASDSPPYFEARLENPAYVTRVQILGVSNIAERGFDALTEFELTVGDRSCMKYRSSSSFSNKTFSCDSFGDSIRIQGKKSHSVLALCEVLVFGKYVRLHRYMDQQIPLPYRPVFSCAGNGANAGNCHLLMDGNLEQNNPALCAAVVNAPSPWLEVILQTPSLIRFMVIYNRAESATDKDQADLNNFEVLVNGQVCFKYDRETSFLKETFPCGRFGFRVRVQSMKDPNKPSKMSICELQLFGYPTLVLPLGNSAYVGCFRESRRDRDLQKMVAIDRMSIEKCERMCRRQRKPFFGLQRGKQCWCSERYGMYGELSRSDCWMQCDGNKNEGCGAKLTNAVYKIN